MKMFQDIGECIDRKDWRGTEAQFLEYLEKIGHETLVKIFNRNFETKGDLDWYPSRYSYITENKCPYPAVLAKALIISKDNESATDAANAYYQGYNLTPEAKKLFLENMLNNNSRSIRHLIGGNGVDGLFENHPVEMKKLFLQASKDELKTLFNSFINYCPKPTKFFRPIFDVIPELKSWWEENCKKVGESHSRIVQMAFNKLKGWNVVMTDLTSANVKFSYPLEIFHDIDFSVKKEVEEKVIKLIEEYTPNADDFKNFIDQKVNFDETEGLIIAVIKERERKIINEGKGKSLVEEIKMVLREWSWKWRPLYEEETEIKIMGGSESR